MNHQDNDNKNYQSKEISDFLEFMNLLCLGAWGSECAEPAEVVKNPEVHTFPEPRRLRQPGFRDCNLPAQTSHIWRSGDLAIWIYSNDQGQNMIYVLK